MNWKKKSFSIRISGIAAIFLMLLQSCSPTTEKQNKLTTLPYYKDATFTPHWLSLQAQTLEDFHRIPAFELLNQEGEIVSEKTFAQKIYITAFFFTTCPGICPKMMDNMAVLQDVFAEEEQVLLLSHSVTPEIDSVSVLKKYAQARGIRSDKWHLVTGDRQVIYDLGRSAYFVEEDLGLEKEVDDFLHTENFVLIDSDRHIRGIYNGLNKTAIAQLIAYVKILQQEK